MPRNGARNCGPRPLAAAEFAHLCGRFVRIKQIGHSNVLYRGHARNSTPTSCNDACARAGSSSVPSCWPRGLSQRAGGPPGRYGGEKPAICTVSGTVTEAAEGGAVPFASVALMSMRDSSIVAGQLAGDDGAFSLTELPFGRYQLQVNFMGYAPYSSDPIMLSPRTTTSYDAGTIALTPHQRLGRSGGR